MNKANFAIFYQFPVHQITTIPSTNFSKKHPPTPKKLQTTSTFTKKHPKPLPLSRFRLQQKTLAAPISASLGGAAPASSYPDLSAH